MSALHTVNKFFPQVKRVTDAKTNAYVEVTDKDVNASKLKNHKQCAMAVACKRKFKLDGVIISKSVAYLIKGTHARRFKVPESVSREVVSFDRGSGFSIGKYALQKVSAANLMGAKSRSKSSNSRRDNDPITKRFVHKTDNVRAELK